MRRSLVLLLLVPAACRAAPADDGRAEVVASFYPLAYLAERIGGPTVRVVDLTPPGREAHDVELSFRDRVEVQEADLVLHLGPEGFQPQVAAAAAEASGTVLAVGGRADDPHVWLDPTAMREIGAEVAASLERRDPARADRYRAGLASVDRTLADLDAEYRVALERCATRTMVVTHAAFGHLASAYGLRQVSVAGLSPEGEPTAAPLQAVAALVRAGEASAIFFEETDEGRRIAEPVADDLRVPLLPLSTLESEPLDGDYLSVMRANLASLREGLACR